MWIFTWPVRCVSPFECDNGIVRGLWEGIGSRAWGRVVTFHEGSNLVDNPSELRTV